MSLFIVFICGAACGAIFGEWVTTLRLRRKKAAAPPARNCPRCRKLDTRQAPYCPHCGQDMAAKQAIDAFSLPAGAGLANLAMAQYRAQALDQRQQHLTTGFLTLGTGNLGLMQQQRQADR